MRHFGHHENRKNEIVRFNAWPRLRQWNLERMTLIENPEHNADEEENEEQRENDNRAEGQRFSTISNVLAGENSLHNQLLSAMRGHHHDRATDHSHPNVER